jgi:tRNA nucleotidyltransferase (CCA-adding enzyme)
VRDSLSQAVALAGERGVALYLVGGAVRDLLLGSAHFDADLVVVGDAIELAKEVGKRLRCRLVSHPRFGTATVKGEGYHLDFVQARSERYERPGALPFVSPGTLADDLARRDFTINAMALQLAGDDVGRLIDQHAGETDLQAGLVRVLHDRSFRDDPTRILRAIRYAGRLGFRLERSTARLLRRDLEYLGSISGARLRHEFERIASEERVAAIVSLAAKLGALSALEPSICVSVRQLKAIEQVPDAGTANRKEAIFFPLLLCGEPDQQTEAQISRLALTGRQAAAVRSCVRLRRDEARLGKGSLRPSQVVELLSETPPEAIEGFALLTDSPLVRDRLRRYLDEWRFMRPRLNGRDIEALGVAHGPAVGAALAALRTARLDGVVSTRDDEVVLVGKFRARSRTVARTRRG